MAGIDAKKIPIVFIVGHGRSGTTLLQSLLNNHPNIVAPPEYDFIIYLYPRFGKIKQFTKTDIKDFTVALFADPNFSIWLMEKEWLMEKLSLAEGADFQTMCKLLMCLTGPDKQEIKLISDKDPIYSLFIRKLIRLFPDAKFIHMIRDPRDSVSGHIVRFDMKNAFFLARRWVRYNAIIEHFKKNFPGKFFTIQYEAMVKNMDETLKSLFTFLDVQYITLQKENLMPEGFQSMEKNKYIENIPADKREEVFNKKVKSIHEGLFEPVNTGNIEKWKKNMNPRDIAITEKITAKAAKKYGYSIEPDKKAKVSTYRMFRSKLVYNMWERYTRWRYSNFKYNNRYRTKFLRNL